MAIITYFSTSSVVQQIGTAEKTRDFWNLGLFAKTCRRTIGRGNVFVILFTRHFNPEDRLLERDSAHSNSRNADNVLVL